MPATVGFEVPAGAQEVTFEAGVLGGRFQQVGDLFYDTAPLVPGEGTKQIVVRYFLPYEGTSIAYSQPFLYPNAQVNLLLAELPQLQATITPLNAAAWEPVETQEFQGRSYRIYRGDALPATEIAIELSGLLAANAADPRAESSTTTIPTTTFAPWMGWSVGVLSLLVLTGGVWWAWNSGRMQLAERPPDLRQEVDDLARRIAQLDDRYALGQLPAESWQQQRGQLKASLLQLARRLKEESTGNTPP
jgi:hypothetical protein